VLSDGRRDAPRGRRAKVVAAIAVLALLALLGASVRDRPPVEDRLTARPDRIERPRPTATHAARSESVTSPADPGGSGDPVADRADDAAGSTGTVRATGTAPGGRGSSSTAAGRGTTGPSEPGDRTPPAGPGPTPPAEDPSPPEDPATLPPAGPTPPPGPRAEEHPDVVGCANLGYHHVGGTADGEADPILLAAAPRFRALAAQLQAEEPTDHLVCAGALRRWRDLVVQPLLVGGQSAGRLVAGTGADHPVVRMGDGDWAAFDWHANGDSHRFNFTGIPLHVEQHHGFRVIRTTYGGVVSVREDSPAIPVLAGAWTLWARDGATMGAPSTIPWGSDNQGIPTRQGFDNGVLELPGVKSPYEAAAAPIEQYRWLDLDAARGGRPPPPPNSLISFLGRGYYVGHDLKRHWVSTPGNWNCARYDLGALVLDEVDVALLSSYPLGERFVCPKKP